MKIGEIERIIKIAPGTIRYWEQRGLIRADRSDNRYREYSEEDIALLENIKNLRSVGIAIADIKLWCDGVVDEKTLLLEHRKRMDSDARESRRLRELCDRLIEGKSASKQEKSAFFTEREVDDQLDDKLLLGVDIGTTSVSAQLISLSDGHPIHTYNIDHNAALESKYAFTADANKLTLTAVGLVKSALGSYKNIVSVGFTGQMHGIVCLDADGNILSPLYTWQNLFGLTDLGGETVCDEIERKCGKSVPTGYGLVTYYALGRLGLLPDGTAKIACISDLAVMRLCGSSRPSVHPTNAASLGFYDLESAKFDLDALAKLGIDESILPELCDDFAICGDADGVPVSVSIGDNQSGAFGAIRDGELLFNIGTSGQVSFVSESPIASAGEARPYIAGRYLHSGSVLCGGRALSMLARLIGEIADRLGTPATKNQIYELINTSALEAKGSLEVSTVFAGTRTDPNLRGAITNIDTSSLTLGELSDGFCRGIVDELCTLLAEMTDSPPTRQVITGNALRRSAALRRAVEVRFGAKPLLPRHYEVAAYGAALFAGVAAGRLTYAQSRELIGYEEII